MDHLLLQADTDAFDREANRLIADGEDRALLDALGSLGDLVRAMRDDAEERHDIGLAVANAGAVAAIALRREKPGLYSSALAGMLAAYRVGAVNADTADVGDMLLYEPAVGALLAVGAVATMSRNWDAVRELVTIQPVDGGYYSTWLRHGQVMQARNALDPADDNVLAVGDAALRRHPGFGMTGVSADARLRALCAFDILAYVVVGRVSVRDYYPNFAKYPAEWIVEPLLELRAEDGEARRALFPAGGEELRAVLREANEMALFQAAQVRESGRDWRFLGVTDVRLWFFIREGGIWEDWPRGLRP